MKKLYVVLGAIGVLALLVSGAWAYTFDNNTHVEAWKSNAAITTTTYGVTPGWHDVIGDPNVFETYGANLTGSGSGTTLTIYTNWGLNDIGTQALAVTSDLFVDVNPAKPSPDGWDYAIKLTQIAQKTTGIGEVTTHSYLVDIVNLHDSSVTTKTSQDLFNGSGAVYGGRYDRSNGGDPPGYQAAAVPVKAEYGDTAKVGTTTVVWTNILGDNPDWTIAFTLGGLTGFDAGNFAFLWGTGTCANDTAQGGKQPEGAVPLPGSLLLLGTGLIGLGAIRRRIRVF